jgi:hypothetical protein
VRVGVGVVVINNHVRSALNIVALFVSTASSSIRAHERLERRSHVRVVRKRRADGKRRRHARASMFAVVGSFVEYSNPKVPSKSDASIIDTRNARVERCEPNTAG